MRRLLIPVFLVVLTPWLAAQPRSAATPGAAPMTMLSVDGIMRGPKLVGSAPTAVRWSKDSSKIYFSWQKADQDRASTYVVNRDGTGLRQMSADETREQLDILENDWQLFEQGDPHALVRAVVEEIGYDGATGAVSGSPRPAGTYRIQKKPPIWRRIASQQQSRNNWREKSSVGKDYSST